jgi:hypothetical protein
MTTSHPFNGSMARAATERAACVMLGAAAHAARRRVPLIVEPSGGCWVTGVPWPSEKMRTFTRLTIITVRGPGSHLCTRVHALVSCVRAESEESRISGLFLRGTKSFKELRTTNWFFSQNISSFDFPMLLSSCTRVPR